MTDFTTAGGRGHHGGFTGAPSPSMMRPNPGRGRGVGPPMNAYHASDPSRGARRNGPQPQQQHPGQRQFHTPQAAPTNTSSNTSTTSASPTQRYVPPHQRRQQGLPGPGPNGSYPYQAPPTSVAMARAQVHSNMVGIRLPQQTGPPKPQTTSLIQANAMNDARRGGRGPAPPVMRQVIPQGMMVGHPMLGRGRGLPRGGLMRITPPQAMRPGHPTLPTPGMMMPPTHTPHVPLYSPVPRGMVPTMVPTLPHPQQRAPTNSQHVPPPTHNASGAAIPQSQPMPAVGYTQQRPPPNNNLQRRPIQMPQIRHTMPNSQHQPHTIPLANVGHRSQSHVQTPVGQPPTAMLNQQFGPQFNQYAGNALKPINGQSGPNNPNKMVGKRVPNLGALNRRVPSGTRPHMGPLMAPSGSSTKENKALPITNPTTGANVEKSPRGGPHKSKRMDIIDKDGQKLQFSPKLGAARGVNTPGQSPPSLNISTSRPLEKALAIRDPHSGEMIVDPDAQRREREAHDKRLAAQKGGDSNAPGQWIKEMEKLAGKPEGYVNKQRQASQKKNLQPTQVKLPAQEPDTPRREMRNKVAAQVVAEREQQKSQNLKELWAKKLQLQSQAEPMAMNDGITFATVMGGSDSPGYGATSPPPLSAEEDIPPLDQGVSAQGNEDGAASMYSPLQNSMDAPSQGASPVDKSAASSNALSPTDATREVMYSDDGNSVNGRDGSVVDDASFQAATDEDAEVDRGSRTDEQVSPMASQLSSPQTQPAQSPVNENLPPVDDQVSGEPRRRREKDDKTGTYKYSLKEMISVMDQVTEPPPNFNNHDYEEVLNEIRSNPNKIKMHYRVTDDGDAVGIDKLRAGAEDKDAEEQQAKENASRPTKTRKKKVGWEEKRKAKLAEKSAKKRDESPREDPRSPSRDLRRKRQDVMSEGRRIIGRPSQPVDERNGSEPEQETPQSRQAALDKRRRDALTRKTRAILGKLAPAKFDSLSQQLIEVVDAYVCNYQPTDMEIVVQMIFDTSCRQSMYAECYTDLCQYLRDYTNSEEFQFGQEFQAGVQADWFRRQLLSCCQKMFEAGTDDMSDMTHKMTDAQRERKRMQNKQKILGNVNFIGQLFLNDLLPGKIITDHVIGFLLNIREEANRQCTENDMEAVCNLFRTIGLKMETDAGGRYKKRIDKYFEIMEKHAQNMSQRLRFKVMDLQDLRKKKWVDPAQKKQKPKAQQPRRHQQRQNGVNRRPSGGRTRQRMKVQSKGGNQASAPRGWGRGSGVVNSSISFADKLKIQQKGDRYQRHDS